MFSIRTVLYALFIKQNAKLLNKVTATQALRAHNPKVAGSNPAPATNEIIGHSIRLGFLFSNEGR